MAFTDTKTGCMFTVKVRTDRKKACIVSVSDDFVVVELSSKPENQKANDELVKFLSSVLETSVKILSGHKSKAKKVFVSGLSSKSCAEKLLKAISD